MAEINNIKFSKELQKQLFPDNSFYKKSRNDSGILIDATSIEIPVSGDIGAAKEGEPDSLPLKVSLKKDSKTSYPATLLYVDPVVISRESEIVTNYDKHQETVEQFAGSIETKAADYAAQHWGPTLAANILRTTGGGRAVTLVGATGNRKRITKADFIAVKKAFSKMNLTVKGAYYALITPDQKEDLLLIPDFVDYDKTGNESRLKEGFIGKLLGFEIMERWNETLGSVGVHYSATNVKKDNGDVAVTDSPAAIFWNSSYTRHGEGNAHTSINRDKAEYLGGTVMSSTVRFGATISRPDEKGVIALVEDNV